MVKMGEEAKNRKLSKNSMSRFINFAEIWGKMQYASLNYGQWTFLISTLGVRKVYFFGPVLWSRFRQTLHTCTYWLEKVVFLEKMMNARQLTFVDPCRV